MAEKKKDSGNAPRKVNVWIPIAVVGVIVALIAGMALMSGSQTGTNNAATTATGTTQGGTTGGTETEVDVSWITLDTTPNEVSAETGVPAKMLQQFLGITEEQMGKPFKDIGGEEVMVKAQSLVAQFGGGSSSSGSTGGGMMGGTSQQ